MSDQIPTQPITKNGISVSSEKAKSPKPKAMTPSEVQKTIEMAGSAAIEAGPIKDLAVFPDQLMVRLS